MRNFWERGADIETERLRLRAWSMHDMQGFLLFAADPEVMMAAGSKPVLSADEARAAGALDTLRDAPWSLRELAVGGDALMPLLAARGVPARQMGRLLEALWRMAAEGQITNETAALLGAAEEWLNRME